MASHASIETCQAVERQALRAGDRKFARRMARQRQRLQLLVAHDQPFEINWPLLRGCL